MFLVSAGLAAAAVLRGRWLAAPLIGLAARCALDTQAWDYYAVGPVLFALLWDMTQGHRFPRWAVAALVLEYASVPLGHGFVSGMCRTFFFVLVTVAFVIRRRQDHQPVTEVSQATRARGLVSA